MTHSGNQPQQIPSCSSAIPGRSPPTAPPTPRQWEHSLWRKGGQGQPCPTSRFYQTVGPGRASSLGRWDGDLGHLGSLWMEPAIVPGPTPAGRLHPGGSSGDHGQLESWSVLAERSQQAKGESPTQDLPDLLRKVPTAVRAAFSATGNTEGGGGGYHNGRLPE